jgi:thioredoxin-like protein
MIIRDSLLKSVSYETYRHLIDKYEAEGKSSGTEQTEDRIHYTALNQKRYKRLDKTIIIPEDKAAFFKNYPHSLCLLVITESWCADAAQILPVVHKITELNPKLTMKIVFRDENEELMNLFLTNGGKAIPIVIFLDLQDNVLAYWGSRPSAAKKMVEDFKTAHGSLTPEFKEDLQKWYNQDKGLTIVDDFINVMQTLPTLDL